MTAMARESEMRVEMRDGVEGSTSQWFALRVDARRPVVSAARLSMVRRAVRPPVPVDGVSGAPEGRYPPRTEFLVQDILLRRKIEAWVPTKRVWHRANKYRRHDKVVVYQPILPGYVLAALPCDAAGEVGPGVNWLRILGCPMVRGVIGFGGLPAPIPLKEIEELRAAEKDQRVDALHRLMPTNRAFRIGDRVEVVGGPFAMLCGKVIELTPREASVLLALFGRETPVRVPPSDLGAI